MGQYDIGIIGAGISGLAAALELIHLGEKVLVIEKEDRIGGLLSCYNLNNYKIERYYHHFFKHDIHLLNLINNLKLTKDIVWGVGSVGYYMEGHECDLNNLLDLLDYKYLSFGGKSRLVKTLLTLRFKKDLSYLDNVVAGDWICKNCGEDVYFNFFKPLLDAKFGKYSDRISAAWLLTRIKVRSDRSLKGETLGYFNGGFDVLLKAIEERITSRGDILLNSTVDKIITDSDRIRGIVVDDKFIEVSTIISTVSARRLKRLCSFPPEISIKMDKIKEQGVKCGLFVLRRPLIRNYWLNIKGVDMPFNVIIEHTNLWKMSYYERDHLVYVVSYDNSESEKEFYSESDEEIMKEFRNSLNHTFGLEEGDIVSCKFSRNLDSGPIYTVGLHRNRVPYFSGIRNLFVAGMVQSYPDRGIEDSIRQGQISAKMAIKFLRKY